MKKIALFAVSALAFGSSWAQVYACKEPNGNMTYSGTPCGANQRIINYDTLQRNSIDTSSVRRDNARRELQQRRAEEAASLSPPQKSQYTAPRHSTIAPEDRVRPPNLTEDQWLERQAKVYSNTVNGYFGCPTDIELRNLRVSASSLTAQYAAKRKLREAQELARECIANGGNVSAAQQRIEERKEAERVAYEAAPPPPPPPVPTVITSCDPGGCWGSDGTRYDRGAGPTFFSNTGRTCQRVGTQLECN